MDKDFKLAFDLLNKNVKNNVKVVTKEDLKQDYLLHITKIEQTYLIPNISKRAGPGEDNTVTRIHVSQNLIDCIAGYSNLYLDKKEKIKKNSFSNKYYIYKVNFKYALKPNKNLVFDADLTNELWLITYNKETIKYKAIYAGYFVLDFVVEDLILNNFSVVTYNLLVKVKEDFLLTKDVNLEPGTYRVVIKERVDKKTVLSIFELVEYFKINEEEFKRIAKRKTFSLENNNKLSTW